jgi:hypothetical protein
VSTSANPLLIVVRQADTPPGTALERSWALPCGWCREVCWVDPESLFGPRGYQLLSLDPVVFGPPTELPGPARRQICCLRCLGSVADADPDLDECGKAALRLVTARFVLAMARKPAGQKGGGR